MTIESVIADYLAHLEQEGRSPHTVAAYGRDLSTFVRFTQQERLTRLADVTPHTLTAFMASQEVLCGANGKRRARASVNRFRVALKALYAFLEARWLVTRNPTAILRCQRHRALPPIILDAREINILLNSHLSGNTGRRDHALIAFMLLTGCRLTETTSLNITDIDLEDRVAILRTTKGGDPDRVMLSPRLVKILTAHIGKVGASDGPLFTANGHRLSTRQVQRIVTARVAEVGIKKPVTPHTLRHTFATRLYNRCHDIRLVQQALRHSHVTTTEVYAQVDLPRWRAAVAGIA